MAELDKSFAEHQDFATGLALDAIKDRYANVQPWGWKDGVLVDQATLEPVSIEGDAPGWEYVVFMPGDIRYLLTKLQALSAKYDELLTLAQGRE